MMTRRMTRMTSWLPHWWILKSFWLQTFLKRFPSHFKALRQVWWWKLPPLIILCLFEQREEPCRFKVKKGCLDLSGCTWVVCLHPHLTMCYLFAAVYIYCSVRAPKADHSREQRVFMFVFFFTSCFEAHLFALNFSFFLCILVKNPL